MPLAPERLPRRIAREAEAVHLARVAAVRWIGTAWVLHPAYSLNPRHSTNPDVYVPARASFLAGIAARAAADRARNPAWRRSQAICHAITREL